MKETQLSIILLTVFIFSLHITACGPGKGEKEAKEKALQDSMKAAQERKIRNDSIAAGKISAKDNDSLTLTDIDGNVYHTITIGKQVWIKENLRVTRYRNGDPIPQIAANAKWATAVTGVYCNYNNDSAKGSNYGRLYNWYAVNDSRGLGPKGWHIASDEEWAALINYLDGEKNAGGKLKDAGLVHWKDPNAGADNMSLFTALPAGYRTYSRGIFLDIGRSAHWWSSTEKSEKDGLMNPCRAVYSDKQLVHRYGADYTDGLSVRCVKD